MIDQERFFAWLDGELGAAEAAAVAELVEQDPHLRAQAERHRALAARLRGAFEPLVSEPVALPGAAIIAFPAGRRERRWWPEAAALAASLVLGLVVGGRLAGPASSPVAVAGDTLVASADLERSLDRRLASAPEGGSPRIGLTFRDRTGRICRTFSGRSASGLACREDEGWAIEALVGPSEGQGGDYRMASGLDPRLAPLVDEMIVGEPFDAAGELAARDRGWARR